VLSVNVGRPLPSGELSWWWKHIKHLKNPEDGERIYS
jgi:hypothetical protein